MDERRGEGGSNGGKKEIMGGKERVMEGGGELEVEREAERGYAHQSVWQENQGDPDSNQYKVESPEKVPSSVEASTLAHPVGQRITEVLHSLRGYKSEQ